MSKCVLCFLPVSHTEFLFRCANERCEHPKTSDSVLSDYLGTEAFVGYSVREQRPADGKNWQPANKFCRTCGQPLERTCSRCHNPLPAKVLGSDVTTIAFAGPRGSGKSVAMKVGISPLFELMVRAGGALTLEQGLSTVKVSDDELKGQVLPATDRRLPWTLVFSMGQIAGRSRLLAIRDIAGEDLAEANPPGRFDYFDSADLVIFMFDPFEVPQVRNALDDVVVLPDPVGTQPHLILGNLLGHVGQGNPHLAVVVGKFDILQELTNLDTPVAAPFQNPGAGFMRSGGESFPYDERTGELLSEEIRSLLALLNAQGLVNLIERPPNRGPLRTRFFAMSALGAATDGIQLSDHGKSPYRVLDPILWILTDRGILHNGGRAKR